MTRMWPWSSGAPAPSEEHNELEMKMGPDVQSEASAYDLQPNSMQATAGQAAQHRPATFGKQQAQQVQQQG